MMSDKFEILSTVSESLKQKSATASHKFVTAADRLNCHKMVEYDG